MQGVTAVTTAMAGVLISGCAARGPIFQDTDVRFAAPQAETCIGSSQQPELAIDVVDEAGAVIGKATADLAAMNGDRPSIRPDCRLQLVSA